jgi:hypothetical protein
MFDNTTINTGPDSVIDITEENGGKVIVSGNIEGKFIAKASSGTVNASNMTISPTARCIISCGPFDTNEKMFKRLKLQQQKRDNSTPSLNTIKTDGNIAIESEGTIIKADGSRLINVSNTTIKEGAVCMIAVNGPESEDMANKIRKEFDLF